MKKTMMMLLWTLCVLGCVSIQNVTQKDGAEDLGFCKVENCRLGSVELEGLLSDELFPEQKYCTGNDVLSKLYYRHIVGDCEQPDFFARIKRSKKHIGHPLLGVNNFLSICTLFIWPCYGEDEFLYDIAVSLKEDEQHRVFSSTLVLNRWECLTLLPVPFMTQFNNAEYDFSFATQDEQGLFKPWKAFSTFESQFIAIAVAKLLASEEVKKLAKELSFKKRTLRLVEEQLNSEREKTEKEAREKKLREKERMREEEENRKCREEERIKPRGMKLYGAGSGFFVTTNGYLVTNQHVVKGGREFRVMTVKGISIAELIKQDPETDLALLKVTGSFDACVLSSRRVERLGSTIFTLGFPQPDIQGFSPKVTKGVVSGMEGFMGDIREYQIDASIQPGNSGGPLFDMRGTVVGVIVAFLKTGQVVNYAIKKSYLQTFLEQTVECSNNVVESEGRGEKELEDIVEEVRSSCVLILSYQ